MSLNLETPALLLDEARMQQNIARMQQRLSALGVAFRPQVKTSKCLEVARRAWHHGVHPERGRAVFRGRYQ